MARFARFDPAAPAPAPVLGWYDTEVFDYPNLPDAACLLAVTDAQWDHRMEFRHGVERGALVALPAPTAVPVVAYVSKAVVVDRLAAAGKLRAVRVGFKHGVADDQLDDAALHLRERYETATFFASDDAGVRAVLAAAGLDPDQVLAPATLPESLA